MEEYANKYHMSVCDAKRSLVSLEKVLFCKFTVIHYFFVKYFRATKMKERVGMKIESIELLIIFNFFFAYTYCQHIAINTKINVFTFVSFLCEKEGK